MPTLRTATVPLFSGEDWAKLRELRTAVEAAVTRGGQRRVGDESTDASAAADAHDTFLAEASERAEIVELSQLPRSKWRALVAEHPIRPDSDTDKALGFNEETFGEDLVRAAITKPTFAKADDLEEWLDAVSDGDFQRLFNEAYRLNVDVGPDPKAGLSSRVAQIYDENSLLPGLSG